MSKEIFERRKNFIFTLIKDISFIKSDEIQYFKPCIKCRKKLFQKYFLFIPNEYWATFNSKFNRFKLT